MELTWRSHAVLALACRVTWRSHAITCSLSNSLQSHMEATCSHMQSCPTAVGLPLLVQKPSSFLPLPFISSSLSCFDSPPTSCLRYYASMCQIADITASSAIQGTYHSCILTRRILLTYVRLSTGRGLQATHLNSNSNSNDSNDKNDNNNNTTRT
jgi:hypothetical protein